MITAKRLFPRGLRRAVLTIGLAILPAALLPAVAGAVAPPVQSLSISAHTSPTRLAPGDQSGAATYGILVTNTGAAPTDGTPITVTDDLPAGVTLEPFGEIPRFAILDSREQDFYPCEAGPPASCVVDRTLYPGETLIMVVPVKVAPSASGTAVNHITVSGGGAPEATANQSTLFTSEPAGFGFESLETSITDADGSPFKQAGGHPYQFHTGFQLNTVYNLSSENPPAGSAKNVVATLPAGMVVNPRATPRCTEAQLEDLRDSKSSCPTGSAVGEVRVTANIFGYSIETFPSPLYNMVPPPGYPAAFAFNAEKLGIFVHLLGGVDSAGDFALTSTTNDVPQIYRISGVRVDLWGDPSDPSHDYRRGNCAYANGSPPCTTEPLDTALLTMPSACSADPLTLALSADSWEESGRFVSGSSFNQDSDGNPVGIDGCNALEFKPTIAAQPTTNLADSPTGLDVAIHQPQSEDFEGLSTATLKDVKVTLPPGMTLNPSAGNGLSACGEGQIGYQPSGGKIHFSAAPQSCPDAAKVGALEVNTPLLADKLPGAIYVAQPYRNPFGSLLAIYLAIEDPERGIVAKLAGKVEPDPTTGQLTATFTENPQLPIEDIETHFFSGPRAALKTPFTCGTKTTITTLVPWSTPEGANANPSDSFNTSVAAAGSGTCPTSEGAAPNKPSFTAGTIAPQAGAYSPFVLKLSRPDGSQQLSGLDATLPKGVTGKLAGIPYCSEAQIAVAKGREAPNQGALEQASPACPAASEVGTVTVGAGAGITPLYVPAHAYLAGPYKGAPLSLVIITPAVAGPFDLGAVVVRTALYINSETAQIHAVSDPFPSILQGIPLDLRSVVLKMDKPGFTLNPTSCDPTQITGSALAATGQSAALTSPFQVGGCGALKFAPKVAISLKGGTKRDKNPALKAVVTYPKGGSYANIASAQVTLPHSEFLDQSHIGTICTRVQFAADVCPTASIYGFAKATTPLLDKPVEGPVYLRSSSHELPDLVAALSGQVDVDLVGRVDTGKGGGIRNTFEAVPDAPVSRFVLEMKGGKKGLLVNSENICRKQQRAVVDFSAQNGKSYEATPLIANSCGKKAKKKHKAHNKAGHGH